MTFAWITYGFGPVFVFGGSALFAQSLSLPLTSCVFARRKGWARATPKRRILGCSQRKGRGLRVFTRAGGMGPQPIERVDLNLFPNGKANARSFGQKLRTRAEHWRRSETPMWRARNTSGQGVDRARITSGNPAFSVRIRNVRRAARHTWLEDSPPGFPRQTANLCITTRRPWGIQSSKFEGGLAFWFRHSPFICTTLGVGAECLDLAKNAFFSEKATIRI